MAAEALLFCRSRFMFPKLETKSLVTRNMEGGAWGYILGISIRNVQRSGGRGDEVDRCALLLSVGDYCPGGELFFQLSRYRVILPDLIYFIFLYNLVSTNILTLR